MDPEAKRSKTSPRAGAKQRHLELMKCSKPLTLDKLSNPQEATLICRMNRPGESLHMGRALTKRLINFIEKDRSRGRGGPRRSLGNAAEEICDPDSRATAKAKWWFDFFPSDDEYGFSFITGTPGAGKTWSLRASVLYLYGKFADERTKGTADKQMKRILFLEGEDFVVAPEDELWRALFRAYADDDAALDELEAMQLPVTVSTIKDFLESKKGLMVVVDDGNKVKRGGHAHDLLRMLRRYCLVFFCASVSSEWIDVMRHPKAVDYELVLGGLNDKELACFLEGFGITKTNFRETGTIPRLVKDYAENTSLFEDTMHELEGGIDQFLVKAVQHLDAERLRRQLAGSEQVPRTLTPFLESRCFYRGQDGYLECLAPRLLHYAKARIAELLKLQDIDSQFNEVALWMAPILRDELRSRISLNAEMATILALKFFECTVYSETGKCGKFNVRRLHLFNGQMSRSVLDEVPQPAEGGTLYVPRSGGHAGLDVYYRDADFIIAVQISVQRNAEDHHHKTVEKAEEIFVGDKRKKILLWVVDTDGWCSYDTGSGGYSYVTMPFGYLSERLAPIDKRLKELRTSVKLVFYACFSFYNLLARSLFAGSVIKKLVILTGSSATFVTCGIINAVRLLA